MMVIAPGDTATLTQTLWASAVVAAVVSGVVSLVTAWLSAGLQARKEESAWQRSSRLDVYVDALNGFQHAISASMKLALDLYVWKVSKAVTNVRDAPEPDHVSELGSALIVAEEAFIVARTRAVVVGSPEIVTILEQMSAMVFEIGTEARAGSDTGSDKWHRWRERADRLRLAFANEARQSLGFSNLPEWPSFSDLGGDPVSPPK